jgi:hypothetical protein
MVRVLLYSSIVSLLACNAPAAKEDRRTEDKQFEKKVENISFTFPSAGYAYDNRDKLVTECLQAIKSNTALLKMPHYTETISIQFLRSRQEMKKYTGMTPSGIALVQEKILYVVANGDPKEVKPPIKHELMHMISMTTWGFPAQDSNWMNEGLAAYAENNCNGYNDEQIFRYLSEKGMLIPMTDLTSAFYRHPEMVAYHQAAYIVQYLLSNYGVEKFKDLWSHGFASFEKIYGIRFEQAQQDMNKTVKKMYPTPPNIDWNIFKVGCL